jgi:hypothetical protein
LSHQPWGFTRARNPLPQFFFSNTHSAIAVGNVRQFVRRSANKSAISLPVSALALRVNIPVVFTTPQVSPQRIAPALLGSELALTVFELEACQPASCLLFGSSVDDGCLMQQALLSAPVSMLNAASTSPFELVAF